MTALDAEMRIDLALSQGIRIDNNLIDLAYYLEVNRFKNRYLALNDLQKPNIIAVYISSSETYDIVRGIVDNDNSLTVQEYGIPADEWNKKNESAAFLWGRPVCVDEKCCWLIVIRHKPQGLTNLSHEIRHILELELGLKTGTLRRVKYGKR